MTLDDLLQHWASWRVKREDGGLGYATTRLGILMGGGVVAGSGNSNLPYGIDADSVGAAIDTAVCRLPKRRQEVVIQEYCRVGEQKAKAAGLKIALKTYEEHLRLARRQLVLQPDMVRLLKNC